MFEEPADDRLDRYPVRNPFDARSQAADAADHQTDVDPGLARQIEPADQAGIGQLVQLGPDSGRPARLRIGDFAVDQAVQFLAQVDRRDRQQAGLLGFHIAGDEVEQPACILPGLRNGGEEAEIGIDARGHRVIVAGAEVAVGAVMLALAAHHHRYLGVGFPVEEAIDHLHAGAFELGGPQQVLLLVEAGLQFDHCRYRFAGFGRRDEGGDHRRLLAGAVQCLLDRHHIGIGRRLAQEIDHHLEAFVGMVDDDVLLADRREAITVMFEDAFGIARRERRELEVGAVLVEDRGQPGDADQPARLVDQRVIETQLVAQQLLRRRLEIVLQLEHDHLAAPPPLDCGAIIADEVFGILLDLDVAVAQHPEHSAAQDAEAGKQQRRLPAQDGLDAEVARAFARQPHEAGQRGRDQDHLGDRGIVAGAHQREQDAHALVGDERERVRRIDRLRGDHRQHVFVEPVAQPLAVGARKAATIDDMDAFAGQFVGDLHQRIVLGIDETGGGIAHHRQLLGRGLAVVGDFLDPAAHLPGDAGGAHHHEFIEVAARDRQEAQPFEQRVAGVAGLGEDPFVERKPAQLAVEEQFRRGHCRGVIARCRHVQHVRSRPPSPKARRCDTDVAAVLQGWGAAWLPCAAVRRVSAIPFHVLDTKTSPMRH
jgi:hypothetical protein